MSVFTPEIMEQIEAEAAMLVAAEEKRVDVERALSYLSSARRYGGKPIGVTKQVYDAINMASDLFEVVGTPTNKEYTFAYGADVYTVTSGGAPLLTCVSRAYVGTSGNSAKPATALNQQNSARQLMGVSTPVKKDSAIGAVVCGLIMAAPMVLYGLGLLG